MLTAAAIVLAALAGFALAWRMLTVTVPPQERDARERTRAMGASTRSGARRSHQRPVPGSPN